MSRTVFCVKLKKDLPGLDEASWPGELGKRIYENVKWGPITTLPHYPITQFSYTGFVVRLADCCFCAVPIELTSQSLSELTLQSLSPLSADPMRGSRPWDRAHER